MICDCPFTISLLTIILMVQKHLDDFAHGGGACIFVFLLAFQCHRRTHLGSVIFSFQCHSISIGSIFLFPRRLCPTIGTAWISIIMVGGLASLSFSTHFNATEEPILALPYSPFHWLHLSFPSPLQPRMKFMR